MQATRRHLRLTAALTLIAFAFVGCGTEYVQGAIIAADGGGDGALRWIVQDTGESGELDAGGQGGPSADVETNREIILLLNADQTQVMAPNGLLPINVKVIDYTLGAPAAGVAVFYEY